jgi:MinD-like ATPase involved in chromosome partitioning or flagellar assembly
VLLAGDASAWEQEAIEVITAAHPGVVLLKRCLDLADLLASASTGTAQVAVVANRLAGLDADSVARLGRHGVRVVAVVAAGPEGRPHDDGDETGRLLRLGVTRVVMADEVSSVVEQVRAAARLDVDAAEAAALLGTTAAPPDLEPSEQSPDREGRLLAVWGPTGAPGRSTVAIAVAAEAATRGLHVTLVDADPYGGAVAQHLGVLEEVSGLLAATRLANAGQLDRGRLATLARQVSPRLRLLTGLPRPDRWTEVRPEALRRLLAAARQLDELVVVDTGFGLPATSLDPFGAAPARDDTTATALEEADQVVLVAGADPVGLTRLARGLRELLELRPDCPVHVVVNRMRPGLGWSEQDVVALVARVAAGVSVSFLPDDRDAADRALVAGRTLCECGDSALRRAVVGLTDALGISPRAARRRPGRVLLRR